MNRISVALFCLISGIAAAQQPSMSNDEAPTKADTHTGTPESLNRQTCKDALLAFQAIPLENSMDLRWCTAPDINPDGFEVQRSGDAKNFSRIGWIEGKDRSSEYNHYLFEDQRVSARGLYYYRLHWIDKNGASQFSSVVAARLTTSGKVIFETCSKPYPEVSSLKYILSRPSLITIEIMDPKGRMIKCYRQGLQDANMYTIPWSGDQPGQKKEGYTANIWCDNQRYQVRLTEN